MVNFLYMVDFLLKKYNVGSGVGLCFVDRFSGSGVRYRGVVSTVGARSRDTIRGLFSRGALRGISSLRGKCRCLFSRCRNRARGVGHVSCDDVARCKGGFSLAERIYTRFLIAAGRGGCSFCMRCAVMRKEGSGSGKVSGLMMGSFRGRSGPMYGACRGGKVC